MNITVESSVIVEIQLLMCRHYHFVDSGNPRDNLISHELHTHIMTTVYSNVYVTEVVFARKKEIGSIGGIPFRW